MIKANKSLGQNFLIDEDVINKIVNYLKIEDETLLEVGPGTGNLTSSLLKKKPQKLIVVEKDDRLVSMLQKKFQNEILIINDDILNVDENKLSKNKLIVFGNLPYNISTEILCKWILNLSDENLWFTNLILMFQKEVANRIISDFNLSSYGRLTILANWKLDIKRILDVKPESFSPKPKIESSLLIFKPKKNFFKFKNPYNLEKITRVFFSQRRKMIKKPFKLLFPNNQDLLEKLNINLNLRPQNLNLETYYELTREYEKLRS